MQHHLAAGEWTNDWLWGLSMIVGSAVLHAFGLMMITLGVRGSLALVEQFRSLRLLERFFAGIATTTLLLVILHSLEAALWALVFVSLGACPDFRGAIYFSLQMATTLGTDAIQLSDQWKLLGPLEGMGGMLMFGLSTAFLATVVQRMWPFPIQTPT